MKVVQARKPLDKARRLLELDYAPEVPLDVLHALERRGRASGLPLHQLELLGQDRRVAEGFMRAFDAGNDEAYLDDVDWGSLEERLYGRTPVFN